MSMASQALSQSVYDFSFPSIEGGTLSLSDYAGKPLLIVNTASECGFTGQYDGLQKLYDEFGKDGLIVIGLPSNDFGKQEKGTADEIKSFCEVNFNITFPLSDKIKVKGDDAHPFYLWAKAQSGFAGRPRWNFHKSLFDRNGQLADWFATTTAPDNGKVIEAIRSVL